MLVTGTEGVAEWDSCSRREKTVEHLVGYEFGSRCLTALTVASAAVSVSVLYSMCFKCARVLACASVTNVSCVCALLLRCVARVFVSVLISRLL